jgi:hypothetical protein
MDNSIQETTLMEIKQNKKQTEYEIDMIKQTIAELALKLDQTNGTIFQMKRTALMLLLGIAGITFAMFVVLPIVVNTPIN